MSDYRTEITSSVANSVSKALDWSSYYLFGHSPPAASYDLWPLLHSPWLVAVLFVCSHHLCPRLCTKSCCCAKWSASWFSPGTSLVNCSCLTIWFAILACTTIYMPPTLSSWHSAQPANSIDSSNSWFCQTLDVDKKNKKKKNKCWLVF